MLIPVLFLALTSTLRLSPGSDVDLARQIYVQTGKPVALLADAHRKWSKQVIGYSDEKELRLRLAAKLGLETPAGENFGLSTEAYPDKFYLLLQRQSYESAFGKGVVRHSHKDGKVSVTTERDAVPL